MGAAPQSQLETDRLNVLVKINLANLDRGFFPGVGQRLGFTLLATGVPPHAEPHHHDDENQDHDQTSHIYDGTDRALGVTCQTFTAC